MQGVSLSMLEVNWFANSVDEWTGKGLSTFRVPEVTSISISQLFAVTDNILFGEYGYVVYSCISLHPTFAETDTEYHSLISPRN